MGWITIIWSATAGICLALAGVHLLIWFRNRTAWANLFFSLTALGVAAQALFELWMMRAATVAEHGLALRWISVPIWVSVVALVGFVRLQLNAGRRWLAWAVCGGRTLSLILNFVFTPNLSFREMTGLRPISFLSEPVAVGEGVTNPWVLVGQLSLFLLVAFVVDAAVTVWRRKDSLLLRLLSGAIVVYVAAATVQGILAVWKVVPMPLVVSPWFIVVVVFMSFCLSADVLRSAKLTEELSQSQQRMSLAVSAAELSLWEWDIARDEIWSTERGRERIGIAANERINLERYLQVVHPHDREPFRGAVRRALEGDGDFEAEYRLIALTGQTLWISARGQVERGPHRKPIRMRGLSVDVTERKHAQLALERSEQLARLLLNATTDLTELLDEDGTLLDLNHAMATRLGGTQKELIGHCVFDRLPLEMVETRRERLRQALLEQRPVRFTDRGRPGEVYDVSIYPIPMPAGEKGRAVVFAHDITEREKVLRALRQSEERLRLSQQVAHVGSFDWNIETGVNVWTPELEALYGLAPGGFAKTQPAWEKLVHPDDRAQATGKVDLALQTGQPVEGEWRVVWPDGSIHWLSSRFQAFKNEAGKPVRLAGVNIDITARKAAEAELQRQRSELARMQRVSTVGHLASTLAHELNQPLGAILRNAEAGELFLQQNPPDYEEVQAILADIKRENQRAGEVIDRTRSLLKRRQPEQGRICLKELLHQLAGLLHSESQTRRVVLHIDVAEGLPQARGDSVQVQQVLLNLVMNAMDAMDETPVEQREVVVTARLADAQFLEVTVSDRGHGISEDKLPRIFDSFFSSKSKGLGMGLAISQTIIQSHGGRIWAENNPEEGAAFRFTLKVASGKGLGAEDEGRGAGTMA